jgi:hypothetical protein
MCVLLCHCRPVIGIYDSEPMTAEMYSAMAGRTSSLMDVSCCSRYRDAPQYISKFLHNIGIVIAFLAHSWVSECTPSRAWVLMTWAASFFHVAGVLPHFVFLVQKCLVCYTLLYFVTVRTSLTLHKGRAGDSVSSSVSCSARSPTFCFEVVAPALHICPLWRCALTFGTSRR